MFSFPINLQSNDIQKFTNNADSGFPKIQQKEVFYSVRNGVWFNQTTWQTASGRVGLLPTLNDDVYIRHNVDVEWGFVSSANIPIQVNNITVTPEGKLLGGPGSGYDFRVFGDFKYYGIYDSLSNGSWDLRGLNNYIDKTRQTTKININYNRAGDQPIMDALYGNISFGNRGFKYTTCDLIIDNLFSNVGSAAFYLMNPHSLTCNGTYNVFFFYSDTEQNITFKGTASSLYLFFCSKNPTIEFQNNIAFNQGNYAGITIDKTFFNNTQFVLPLPYGANQSFYFGTGLVKFTTNNITINNTGTISLDNNFLIDPNIIVTNNVGSNMNVYGTWNGSNGVSALINKGFINFASSASIASMTTGIFDITTFANTVGYVGNYSATIPSAITTFHNLTIGGTGTKTLGVNTTLNGNLLVYVSGILDFSIYNIDIIGTTTVAIGGGSDRTGTINKSGPGNVIFRGLLLLQNSATPKLNFSGGNPTVELRGGIQYGNGADPINSGTGQWSFTTNNQEIRHISGIGPTVTLNCPILIASGITVTATSTFPFTSILQLNNSVNGADASSILVSSNNSVYITNASFPQPMTTGVFDITTNANILGYAFNGNYTIPYTAFSNLYVVATGTKSLSGNTTLSGGLFISSLGVLECLTYNLTVIGGASTAGSTSTLSKNGAGSIVLGGLSANINFSGNPTVEIKGNMSVGNQNVFNTGTGQWTFSTINSSITNIVGNPYTPTFNCPILVSGITLTMASNFIPQTFIFTGLLDGSDVASTFRMGTGTPIVDYRNATQPMATGVLDTSTNLNTWIYGLNNQDIKGGTYRNLTLNGTGVKTLQGNVSVLNTYTLTAPATLANNGFTLTNP